MKSAIPTKSGTRIIACDCKHEFQDSRYGRGKRVANVAPKAKAVRCTVCGKSHPE